MVSLFGLDPLNYVRSTLHQPDRTFPETNCYVDLWIELLHAQGIPPESAMAFACMVDFEGDQWTFFKPPPQELLRLFGIDVHEIQLYRPLTDHVTEYLRTGRSMTIEVDSFYLPDTEGTSYRREHVKSSIAVEGIDLAGQRLRYFHGQGYFELSDADYRGVFRLEPHFTADVLPPYAELINFHAAPGLQGEALRRGALQSMRRQMNCRPARNPWTAFGERLAQDMPGLLEGSENRYHAYAFATVRQCGAAFETAASFMRWLALGSAHAATAIDALSRQATGSKTLLFKLARRRAFDPGPAIRDLAADWNSAMQALEDLTTDHIAAGAEGRAA